jgi:hypothetical protein
MSDSGARRVDPPEAGDGMGSSDSASGPHYPLPPPGRLSPAAERALEAAERRLDQGDLTAAGELLEEVLNQSWIVAGARPLCLYARYLLDRHRPFSARRTLEPLVAAGTADAHTRLLHAESLMDLGKLDVAAKRLERLAATAPEVASEARELHEVASQLAHGPPAEARERWAEEVSNTLGLPESKLFGVGSLEGADEHLGRAGQGVGSIEAWCYYLGEVFIRALGGRWRWRRDMRSSVVELPSPSGPVKLNPYIWVQWEQRPGSHRFRELLDTLQEIARPERGRAAALIVAAEDDPLSVALYHARTRARRGETPLALGVVGDCPFARFAVPLVVRRPEGTEAVLVWAEPGHRDDFFRFLDMMCLGPLARVAWSVVRPARVDAFSAQNLALYESGDRTVRAALLARRLCSANAGANARWFAYLANLLLDCRLDGAVGSLKELGELLTGELRRGSRRRWGRLYEDRYSILFMLTCYTGEVLRARYGGRWGADRLTGRPMGPTSGLELPGLRFNLGVRVLRAFFQGGQEGFGQAVAEYAQRAIQRAEGSS